MLYKISQCLQQVFVFLENLFTSPISYCSPPSYFTSSPFEFFSLPHKTWELWRENMGKIIFFLRTTRALSYGGEIISYFWLGLGCKDDRNALTLKHFQKCYGNMRYFWLGLGCKDDRISLLKKACSFESFQDYARWSI